MRQQPKDFYAAGFDTLVKRWDKCINVGGGYVEKFAGFFSGTNTTFFYVLYQFVISLLTLSCSVSKTEAVRSSEAVGRTLLDKTASYPVKAAGTSIPILCNSAVLKCAHQQFMSYTSNLGILNDAFWNALA
jgi:hypothetical protein